MTALHARHPRHPRHARRAPLPAPARRGSGWRRYGLDLVLSVVLGATVGLMLATVITAAVVRWAGMW